MRNWLSRLGWTVAVLGMVLAQGQALAIEATPKGDTLALSGDGVTMSVQAAKGLVAVKVGDQTASGKGSLLCVSQGKDGKTAVADLAKAKPPVTIGADNVVAARVPFHASLPLGGVALWDAGGAASTLPIPVGALGFPAKAILAGYDMADQEFIGPIIGSFARQVRGGQCKFVALAQATDRPVLLCTSRTPAANDVSKLAWDAKAGVLSGTSNVPKATRYELRLWCPPEPVRWVATAVTMSAADAKAGVTTDIMQTYHWLRVFITSPTARAVSWKLTFARQKPRVVAAGAVGLSASASSTRSIDVITYGVDGAAVVRRNDGVEMICDGRCTDTSAEPNTEYTYTLFPLSWVGRKPAAATAKAKTPAPPPMAPLPTVYLSDLRPVKATSGWNGEPRRDLSIDDNPIRIGGELFKRGIGTHAVSEIIYKVRTNCKRFVASVGVDDEKDSGSVTFEVYADDKQIYKSGTVAHNDTWKIVDVALPKGTKRLRLVVGDAGDGIACDHADWANAGFITEGEAEPEVEPLEPGFTRIFNGKDLTGWDGDPRFWSVRKGAIRGETTPEKKAPHNTFIVWRGGKLRDFVLKLKFRIRGPNNSGVQYRSEEFAKWRIRGYQAEVAAGAGQVGLLYHEAGRGRLAAVGDFVVIDGKGEKQVVGHVADRAALIKAGYYRDKDWNEYTITARGNHLIHQLNGHTTMELIDRDAKIAAEGLLALQIHAGPPMLVEFTDIRIKHLEPIYGKAIHLFNGKDLAGWVHSSPALRNTWGVKDGVITNTGRPAGYIRTTTDYTNYIIRVQLRHITRGNSGVLLRKVGKDKVWPRSIECQGQIGSLGDIWNIDKFPMKADPTRTRGRHTRKAHPSNENPLGQWNQYEITLDGGRLEIKVNDLIQNIATDCWETPGKICLQSEGAQMEYRNVVIIPIERPKKK